MSDFSTANTKAIATRLAKAGFLSLVERIAKRSNARFCDIVTIAAKPSVAHVTMWAALAKEGQTPQQIAHLVGWAEPVIRRAIMAPEPAPQSVRTRKGPSAEVLSVVDAAARRHGLTLATVLTSDKALSAARRDAVVALTACGMSQQTIADALGVHLSAVQQHQRAAGIAPALKRTSDRKAA